MMLSLRGYGVASSVSHRASSSCYVGAELDKIFKLTCKHEFAWRAQRDVAGQECTLLHECWWLGVVVP
jgi:hypothetical protein